MKYRYSLFETALICSGIPGIFSRKKNLFVSDATCQGTVKFYEGSVCFVRTQSFPKNNISYPLIRKQTCAYQGDKKC